MKECLANITRYIYYINTTGLEFVLCHEYLSVQITSNLSWKTHIDDVNANANCMLGYVKQNFA